MTRTHAMMLAESARERGRFWVRVGLWSVAAFWFARSDRWSARAQQP